MKNIRLKYFLPIAVALLVLIPAALVAWTSWNAARDAAEVVARALMNQAAIRLDGETRADLGQAGQLLDSFAKSSDINQQIPDINKVQPIANFEAAAWGPVRGQDLVRYAYFGSTNGEFLGVDATNTGPGKQNRVRVGVRAVNETRRWFFFAALPGDRSEPDSLDSADYDPRTRPWYKAAVSAASAASVAGTATGLALSDPSLATSNSKNIGDSKNIVKRAWTSVYPSFSKNELLVTQSVAVHDSNAALVGVIAVDLSLKRLGTELKSLQISPNGVAFIIDEKGLLVATSSNEVVTGTKDSPRMLASAAANGLIQATAGQAFITTDIEQRKIVNFHKFNFNDVAVIAHVATLSQADDGRIAASNIPKWRLVIAAPESDFTGAFNAKLKGALLWAIGLFLLAILIGIWLAQRLVGSVSQVVDAAARIGKGDLSRPMMNSRFAEFRQINHEMGDTADALRQSRDALMAQNQMLEQKVAERTKDLQFQTEEALQAVRAKASFLATMSHEIRTPMNGVIGMTGLLAGTPLNVDQRDYVETIRTSGDALLTIINDILDFSKIESGKMTLEREPLTLMQVIEESFSLVGAYANQKGLELLVEMDADVPPHVLGDITRLRQIFINIINNAVKFTDHGEVIVHVRKGTGNIIFCDITDTGIGIPPDRINALFAAFTQVDVTTTRKHGGTGLGLAISKRLAELMGGDITISSVLGRGSTFSISIEAPPSAAPQQAALNARNNDPAALIGKKALIVDDNPTHLRILAKRLQMWGMQVTTAVGTNRVLETLAAAHQTTHHFDVIIIDYLMPVEDGLSLGRKIRANAATAKLPLIMLTSVSTSRADDTTQIFNAHLVKPPRESQLLDALMTAVYGASSDHSAAIVQAPTTGLGQQFAALYPLKMLVVDDNSVNRKVATIMLSKLGYSVKTADDGRAAIADIFAAKGTAEPYQLVWMDVHMPNMDGYEATKVLRDPKSDCAKLRIVAMTAAAMEGDREACIEAGMDDYVSKPLQHRDLVAALERAIASGISPAVAAPATGSVVATAVAELAVQATAVVKVDSAPNVVNHFDAERLDELAEYDEDGSLVSDLADVFCRQAPEMVASISAANAAGDIEGVIGAAHQLKGAASNIGVTLVFNTADLIEMQCRRDGLSALQTNVAVQAALQTLPENLNKAMLAVRTYAEAVRARAAANSQNGGTNV
jgi:signal transduction histidine kinase/DNA-binding response OmpR family regulator/HPt (histidine-containing phosphotransfer) domain-containing protein